MTRPRARELGLPLGMLPSGPHNAITDVAGLRVGHTTLIAGEGALRPGQGPVRTGVTVILPHGDNLFREKVRAAVHTINGFGKACGFEEVRELGVIEAPIALTGTLNVGLVADGLVQYAIRQSPEIGIHTTSVNVVVRSMPSVLSWNSQPLTIFTAAGSLSAARTAAAGRRKARTAAANAAPARPCELIRVMIITPCTAMRAPSGRAAPVPVHTR